MEFLRYCEVTIGPLADWLGGGPSDQAVKIVSDGSSRGLRVAFNARRTLTGSPNQIDLSIWGLSKATMRSIRGNLSKIQIVAGYSSDNSSAELVASGAILSAVPDRQGADVVMRITALDGYGGMVRGSYSKAFAGRTPVDAVVREIAASMPGVTVGMVDVRGVLYPKGQQFSGPSAAQLNKLADQFGFSWSVQDGVFQAVSDDRDTGRVFAFDTDTNLISAVPLLNGPMAANVGVEVVAKFDARMKPGDRMVVRSSINPDLNGSYKVTSMDLSFDSHGGASIKAQSLHVL